MNHSFFITRRISILLLLTSGTINADALKNWEVDGLNGGLQVNAALVAAPCSLSSESSEQAIDLGSVSRPFMTTGGRFSTPVILHFTLDNCLFGQNISQPEHGGLVAINNKQSGIVMKLRAAEDPNNHEYFKLYGNSKGIALKIEDASQHELRPDERSWSQTLDRGRNDLMLKVQIARTSDQLEFGEYHAVIHLDLEYL